MKTISSLVLCVSAILFGMAGCAQAPVPVGLVDVTARPAERALLSGMNAYDNGQYDEAEKQLNLSLNSGLVSPKDMAAAQKYLAFIYCTSNRATECEAAFRAARKADPAFALSRSEQGHPVWGPVYKRIQP